MTRRTAVGAFWIGAFLCAVGLTISAATPSPSKANSELARLLQAAQLVKIDALAGALVGQERRADGVVPAAIVELLKQETIVVGNPWWEFRMVDGQPTWFWRLGTSSGIYGMLDETTLRLASRLTDLGFAKVDPPNKDFVLAYRRAAGDFEETVLLRTRDGWVGGKTPTVGLQLEWSIQAPRKSSAPHLDEVLQAMPTLKPAADGKATISAAVLQDLMSEQVESVALHGAPSVWQSLNITLPKAADGKLPAAIAKMEATLQAEKYHPSNDRRMANEEIPMLDLRRSFEGTANCHMRVFDRKDAFVCVMFLQTR